MSYRVVLSTAVRKQIDNLQRNARSRVIRTIDVLAENPRPPNAMKMSGRDNQWRVRTGDYRIIYEIHDKELLIMVIKIGHRRDVYRRN